MERRSSSLRGWSWKIPPAARVGPSRPRKRSRRARLGVGEQSYNTADLDCVQKHRSVDVQEAFRSRNPLTLSGLEMSRWKIAMRAPSFSTPLRVVTDVQLNVFHRTVEQMFAHMKRDMPDPIPHLLDAPARQWFPSIAAQSREGEHRGKNQSVLVSCSWISAVSITKTLHRRRPRGYPTSQRNRGFPNRKVLAAPHFGLDPKRGSVHEV